MHQHHPSGLHLYLVFFKYLNNCCELVGWNSFGEVLIKVYLRVKVLSDGGLHYLLYNPFFYFEDLIGTLSWYSQMVNVVESGVTVYIPNRICTFIFRDKVNIPNYVLFLWQTIDEKVITDVFLKVLDNYIKWCRYLRIRLVWNKSVLLLCYKWCLCNLQYILISIMSTD